MLTAMGIGLNREHANWWLHDVLSLDLLVPGLCGNLLRGSQHRRHASAAVLAHKHHRDAGATTDPLEIAMDLGSMRLSALLGKYLPSCPGGYRSALRRVRDRIEAPSFYIALREVYDFPDHVEAVRALRHCQAISPEIINVAARAPAWLLRTGCIAAFRSTRHLDDFLGAVSVLRDVCPSMSDAAISHSLRTAKAPSDIINFINNWMEKSEFPAPVMIHPDFVPLATARCLKLAAKEYENCLAGFVLDCLSGREYFYRAATPFGGMIARISRQDTAGPWRYVGVSARQNRAPPTQVENWTQRRFEEAGIAIDNPKFERPSRFRPIERILDPFTEELEDWLADSEAMNAD